MKTMRFYRSILSFVLLTVTAGLAAAQAPAAKAPVVFTEKDREFALKYLNDTRDDYVKQLTGISDGQLNFRSGEGRWTIAEIAEHITLVEQALFGMITNGIMKSPPPKCEDPFRVADTMLLATADNQLIAITADGQIKWSAPIEHGDLTGAPLAQADSILVSYKKGVIERRLLPDGKSSAAKNIEQPLSTGPVAFLQKLIVAASDGTLLVIDQP